MLLDQCSCVSFRVDCACLTSFSHLGNGRLYMLSGFRMRGEESSCSSAVHSLLGCGCLSGQMRSWNGEVRVRAGVDTSIAELHLDARDRGPLLQRARGHTLARLELLRQLLGAHNSIPHCRVATDRKHLESCVHVLIEQEASTLPALSVQMQHTVLLRIGPSWSSACCSS